MKNLKETAYMLSGHESAQFGQKKGLGDTGGHQERKHGTMCDEELKHMRGLDTFSREHLNPAIDNQSIFGIQATGFNIVRSHAANS